MTQESCLNKDPSTPSKTKLLQEGKSPPKASAFLLNTRQHDPSLKSRDVHSSNEEKKAYSSERVKTARARKEL